MYLLGYDIGTSSIKAAIVDAGTGKAIKIVQQPNIEMGMIAHEQGWAEQNPEDWWKNVCLATKELLTLTNIDAKDIKGIGISYQMHGLVTIDSEQEVLRPSIIWCDSRAVEIGDNAFQEIGEQECLTHMLNSPGNFTASKLKWVKENEPDLYARIDKVMLPGDYIAMKLTGEVSTTVSGLSEGVFWDFKNNSLSSHVMNHFGFDASLIPKIHATLSIQGITDRRAEEAGLPPGIPVAYRAGDQPNNALSLGVFKPNEVAATGGTSGVIYGVVDKAAYDPKSRVNGFAHVNHTSKDPRIGILLCINGTGIQYAWIKNQIADKGMHYKDIEKMATDIAVGSDGLCIIPFGNGAERILENKNPGSQIRNLHFNIHSRVHMYRAALEGIAFSFHYGFQLLRNLGLNTSSIKVGNDNLFQSKILASTVCNLIGCEIEMIDTTGAVGAAQASGVGTGIYESLEQATCNRTVVDIIRPIKDTSEYQAGFDKWKSEFDQMMNFLS